MMIKIAVAIGLLIATYSSQPSAITVTQQETPSYAKWSRLAIQQAQVNYPDASIIDYLYMGSSKKEEATVATFKLWLREGTREYGVVVSVTYITKTEKLETVEFQEIIPPG